MRCRAGSLLLLPRLSVSIVFKMLPYQCFKPLRLFGMARLCGYLGRFFLPRRLSSLSPPCLCGLRLIACVLCVAARPFLMPSFAPAASRSPLRPIRYDKRGGGYGSPYCLLRRGVERGVRSRFAVAIMRPLRLLAPCVPRIARRHAAHRIADARPFRFLMVLSHDALTHPFSSCPHFNIASSNRHGRRGEGRDEDGCLAGSCYMISCCVICRTFSLYVSYSCYISRILVICPAFLLYISHSCYMSRILVISTCFVLYYFVEIMRLWAGVFN